MAYVEVSGLTKKFTHVWQDDIVAVENLSFSLEGDEILSLVGPSGCGKTTTLRCIAGLETLSEGEIRFAGRRVNDLPPQERNISMLFQDPALWNNRTVFGNIAYGLRIQQYDEDDIDDRVRSAADRLKISGLLDKRPDDLSGGQQQRVAMGRALVQDPDLFLLDEPMSDLDAALKEELRPMIQKIIKDAEVPAIYVTHNQEEAMTLSDKVAVMKDGNIQHYGTPSEVYDAPRTKFVAEFIGKPSMNFFEAEPRNVGGTTFVDIGDVRIPVVDEDQKLGDVGVRPADIEVLSTDEGGGIEATHVLDETVGERKYSYFRTEYGEIVAITPATFSGDGDDYRLTFKSDAVHVF